MGKINYEKYKGLSLDALTPRQKQVMQMRLSGMEVKEIVEELGISQGAVSTLLHNARERLDGIPISTKIYYRENIEKFKKYKEEHKDEIRERKRQYHYEHRDERLKKMKEYNKEYYRENRDKILAKKRRQKMSDES